MSDLNQRANQRFSCESCGQDFSLETRMKYLATRICLKCIQAEDEDATQKCSSAAGSNAKSNCLSKDPFFKYLQSSVEASTLGEKEASDSSSSSGESRFSESDDNAACNSSRKKKSEQKRRDPQHSEAIACEASETNSTQIQIDFPYGYLYDDAEIEEFKDLNNFHIRLLSPDFSERGLIQCQLADIAPKSGRPYYSQRAKKEFKRLVMDSKFRTAALFTRINHNGGPHSIVLEFYPGNNLIVNLNSALVNRLDCVISTGPKSLANLAKPDENSPPMRWTEPKQSKPKDQVRLEIKKLNIINPSCFFVSLKHREKEIQQLHELVQREAQNLREQKSGDIEEVPKEFKRGESCYVKMQDSSSSNAIEYFRGEVCRKDPSGKFAVFLVDEGKNFIAEASELLPVMKPFDRREEAIKMHMAGAKPTNCSKQYSSSAIDKFKQTLGLFKDTFVSIVDDSNGDESYPVIVWGVVVENIDFREQTQFHNINAYLHNEGLIDAETDIESLLKQERYVSDKEFGFHVESSECSSPVLGYETADVDENIETVVIEGVNVSNVPHEIKTWAPAAVLSVGDEYKALVTDIDENGILSLRDKKQDALFQALTKEITKIYSETIVINPLKEIAKGHAVIINNVIDGKFYRGSVEGYSQEDDRFLVRFIDVGTAAFFSRADIFVRVVGDEIPVLTHKCRFASLVPKEKGFGWEKDTMDTIYGEIVNRKLNVKVENIGDVYECTMKTNGVEVSKFLVDVELARYRDADDAWPPKTESTEQRNLDDFSKYKYIVIQKKRQNEELDMIAASLARPATVDVSVEQTKKYLAEFDKDINIKLYMTETYANKRKLKTARSTAVDHPYNFETIREQLKPRSHRAVKPEKTIQLFDLQESDIRKFICTFVDAYESTKVFLDPDIPELNNERRKLKEALDELEEPMLVKMNRPEKHERDLCLVRRDEEWFRGTIVGLSDLCESLVKVFLVDLAAYANIDSTSIYRLPNSVAHYPRNVLKVELGTVVANDNFVEADIIKMLKSELQGQRLFAEVLFHNENNSPQVELTKPNGSVAYQSLIDEQFYLRAT